MNFLDNAIDLPWQNAKFSKSRGKHPYTFFTEKLAFCGHVMAEMRILCAECQYKNFKDAFGVAGTLWSLDFVHGR